MYENFPKTRTWLGQAENIQTCQKSALGVVQFLNQFCTYKQIYTIKTQLKFI